jgi:hypothetical protein
MLVQLLVGGVASLINIAIHSLWTVFLDHAVRRFWAKRPHARFLRDRVILMLTPKRPKRRDCSLASMTENS